MFKKSFKNANKCKATYEKVICVEKRNFAQEPKIYRVNQKLVNLGSSK